MLGHQHICALAYALAFVMNVVLCVALVPRFGGHGAAAATSISLAFETVLLFWIVRQRLGLHVLAFGKLASRLSSPREGGGSSIPEKSAFQSMGPGVLDAPLSRGMTAWRGVPPTPRSSRRRSRGWRR